MTAIFATRSCLQFCGENPDFVFTILEISQPGGSKICLIKQLDEFEIIAFNSKTDNVMNPRTAGSKNRRKPLHIAKSHLFHTFRQKGGRTVYSPKVLIGRQGLES